LLSVVAVPITTSPFRRVIVELASAVPVIIGVVSFVSEEVVARVAGASGAVVSIVMDIDDDTDEILPAESVAVAVREYTPSARAEEGETEKFPSPSAVAVPITTSPLRRVIVALASEVPVIVGVVLFVIGEVVDKVVGAIGAVESEVSIVMEIEADFDDIFPTKSVAVNFKE